MIKDCVTFTANDIQYLRELAAAIKEKNNV